MNTTAELDLMDIKQASEWAQEYWGKDDEMKKFKVTLTRAYAIEVHAEDITSARRVTEFYIGDPADISTEKERKKRKFKLGEMEMVMNEAFDAEELKEV